MNRAPTFLNLTVEDVAVEPGPLFDGAPVYNCGRCHILKRDSSRIKNKDLMRGSPSRFPASDHFTEICMNLFQLHCACGDCMMQISDPCTLFAHIGHNAAASQKIGLQFLFIMAVS